jgi:hypothetical protein
MHLSPMEEGLTAEEVARREVETHSGGGGGSGDGGEGSGEEEGDAIVTVSLVHLLITTGGKFFTIPGLIYFSRVRRMQYMASSIIVL